MSSHPHTKHFTQVDRTKDPDSFVRFMDETQRPAGIQASKRLMLERMPITPGDAVLELGAAQGPTCSRWRRLSARMAVLSGSTRASP